MIKIKGNLIYTIQKNMISIFGQDGYEDLYKHFQDRTRNILDNKISLREMYNRDIYQDIIETVYKHYGIDNLQKLSKSVARKQLTGFYNFFIKFITWEEIFKKTKKIWSNVYSQGKIDIIESNDEKIVIEVSEFPLSEAYLVSLGTYLKEIILISTKKELENCDKIRINDDTTRFVFCYKI